MTLPWLLSWSVFPELSEKCMCAKSSPLCPTLCNPMDQSPSGSSVHGILQGRIPEWVIMFGKWSVVDKTEELTGEHVHISFAGHMALIQCPLSR